MLTTEVSAASNQNVLKHAQHVIYECKHKWTHEEEVKLLDQYIIQQGNWKSISVQINGPTPLECMIKWQQLNPQQALSRQLWSQEEDEQLKELVQKYGKKWSKICTVMNWRTGKQVRERYLNQLQGHINLEKWTEEEDKTILRLYKKFGTKWSYISSFLKGRPENMVKNRFYANLKRRYQSDIEDSEEEENQDNSQDSLNISKYKKKKKQKPYKYIPNTVKIKKSLLENSRSELFKRMTRSKNKSDENIKEEEEQQNNIDNNIIQNISQEPEQKLLIKEEINQDFQPNSQYINEQCQLQQFQAFQNFLMEYKRLQLYQQQCQSNFIDTQQQLCQKCINCQNFIDQPKIINQQDITQLYKLFQYQMFTQYPPSSVDMINQCNNKLQ